MKRLWPLLCALLVYSLPAPGHGQSNATPKNKPNARPSAKLSKPSDTQKISTSGFSFLIEPTPHWVQAVERVTDLTLAPSAPIHILLNDEQINVEGQSQTRFLHMEKRVNASAGLSTASQIQIEFNPTYQELVIHKIEVLRGDSRIDKLDPKRVQLLQRETQLEARLYDGRVTASVVLDDVRVGDRIEYSYSVRGSNPVFDGKFFFIDSTGSAVGPVGQYQLRIIAPEQRSLYYKYPKNVAFNANTKDGKQESTFKRHNIAQEIFEESSTINTYTEQFIQVSEFANWNEVARWGTKLFEVAYRDDERVMQQVTAWKTLATPQEKLRAALDFVQKDVRYFGTEIGINSHKPDRPSKVIAQRYGDCKDKTTLLIALLRVLDIQAKPVFVSTVFREETSTLLPSPIAFNHVIAAVEVDGKYLWLDPTRDQQTGPAIKREVRDYGRVLLAEENSAELTLLPSSLKELHRAVEDRMQLQDMSKTPTLISNTIFYGAEAEAIRNYIAHTPLSEVQAHYVKPYLRPYPKIAFNGELKIEEIPEENAIQLTQQFSMKDFWNIKDNLIDLKADLSFWSLEEQLQAPKDLTRKSSYRINDAGIYRHSIISEFADDLLDEYKEEKFVDGQANFTLNGSLVSSKQKSTWITELHYNGLQVSPAQWRSYVEKAKQVRKHFYYQLVAHPLNQQQREHLEKELKAVGKTRNLTNYELNHMRIVLYANTMLQSDRISPELKKLIHLFRASGFLVLNSYERAAHDVNAALALMTEPEANVLSVAALVSFSLQKDTAAEEYINEALEISPHDKSLHQLKIRLNYVQDKFEDVVTHASQQLETRDADTSFLGLLRYLANRRLGNADTTQLEEQLSAENSGRVITNLIKFYLGKATISDLIRPEKPGQINLAELCEVYYFAAEKMLVDGNLEKAREYWKLSITTGLTGNLAFMASKRRLNQYPAR